MVLGSLAVLSLGIGLKTRADSVVVFNEIQYHPAAAGSPEWIELHNTADIPVPVGGWRLAGAVRYEIPEGTQIPEGGYLVIARNAGTFAAKFPDVPVLGDFSGSLSNRGEELFLIDEDGSPADRVYYRDGFPWPGDADGGGSSLELRNPLIDNSVADIGTPVVNGDINRLSRIDTSYPNSASKRELSVGSGHLPPVEP